MAYENCWHHMSERNTSITFITCFLWRYVVEGTLLLYDWLIYPSFLPNGGATHVWPISVRNIYWSRLLWLTYLLQKNLIFLCFFFLQHFFLIYSIKLRIVYWPDLACCYAFLMWISVIIYTSCIHKFWISIIENIWHYIYTSMHIVYMGVNGSEMFW